MPYGHTLATKMGCTGSKPSAVAGAKAVRHVESSASLLPRVHDQCTCPSQACPLVGTQVRRGLFMGRDDGTWGLLGYL
jgi:hypothetical protein